MKQGISLVGECSDKKSEIIKRQIHTVLKNMGKKIGCIDSSLSGSERERVISAEVENVGTCAHT